jgi:hypothetical protein
MQHLDFAALALAPAKAQVVAIHHMDLEASSFMISFVPP